MDNKKWLGMPKNVLLGLSWLFFPLGIVDLAMNHQDLNEEEKKQIVSTFVAAGIATIISIIVMIISSIVAAAGANIGWLFTLINVLCWAGLCIVPMIFAFMNENFHCPVLFDLAGKFVKGEDSEASKKEDPAEAEKEEASEEKAEPEEAPKEE